jgi:hypothetical protein
MGDAIGIERARELVRANVGKLEGGHSIVEKLCMPLAAHSVLLPVKAPFVSADSPRLVAESLRKGLRERQELFRRQRFDFGQIHKPRLVFHPNQRRETAMKEVPDLRCQKLSL